MFVTAVNSLFMGIKKPTNWPRTVIIYHKRLAVERGGFSMYVGLYGLSSEQIRLYGLPRLLVFHWFQRPAKLLQVLLKCIADDVVTAVWIGAVLKLWLLLLVLYHRSWLSRPTQWAITQQSMRHCSWATRWLTSWTSPLHSMRQSTRSTSTTWWAWTDTVMSSASGGIVVMQTSALCWTAGSSISTWAWLTSIVLWLGMQVAGHSQCTHTMTEGVSSTHTQRCSLPTGAATAIVTLASTLDVTCRSPLCIILHLQCIAMYQLRLRITESPQLHTMTVTAQTVTWQWTQVAVTVATSDAGNSVNSTICLEQRTRGESQQWGSSSCYGLTGSR